MSLQSRVTLRLSIATLVVAALTFAPAGSFAFWQGWVFMGIFAVFNALFVWYFCRRDPELVKRRLERREPRAEQKVFKMIWVPLWLITLTLPGFDYRFGWSAGLGGVPPLVSAFAAVVTIVAWLMVFHVMRYNSFASAIVQVERGQQVITDGPYRRVRHPMYTGFSLMILAAPLALGSWVALVPAAILIPVLVYRLGDEERLLRKDLPGYAEYCERTRYRLVPYVF
jgi:protein-S-isoprenylcysteine O-methyltransferase Ste14